MAKDKEKPESSVRFAWSGSAAVKREMAVWIDPAQREKKDSVDWEDHLVDSESLRTDSPGEKDPVEKAEDPGKKSGGGEENGSSDQWVSFMG